MDTQHHLTDFSTVRRDLVENEMSRRFLRLVTAWIPFGRTVFDEWPERPDCGHFFGGVLWYGQETAMSIVALAIAAASPEFDESLAGISQDEVKKICRRGLRYLCFTHDTGPKECVRPSKSWGRTEPAGTKWGEREFGFFKASQCGRVIANLAVTAALLDDILGDEERGMLATIAADYLGRFGNMDPKSGVFYDTQTEENAWTALGLTASLMLLAQTKESENWWETTRLWMFRTSTKPQDSFDFSHFADGKTVAQLCGSIYTTLPDGTCENHGFVHPNYMASSINLGGTTANLMHLFGLEPPTHLMWRGREFYSMIKGWCDDTGTLMATQGMDWPYYQSMGYSEFHAFANVYLNDPDAPLYENRALEILERVSRHNGGRLLPEETRHCHGIQDPAIMGERFIALIANGLLAHRLMGKGGSATGDTSYTPDSLGVRVFPHGGLWIHRHSTGMTSFSWRNKSMVLPQTKMGLALIGPASGTMLAKLTVRDRAHSTHEVMHVFREADDRVCSLFVENIFQKSVRWQVYCASLPDGRCLTAERLFANEDITVERVEQGFLHVMNDSVFTSGDDPISRRRLFYDNGENEEFGEKIFEGYASADSSEDELFEFGDTGWINLDDQAGLVFDGSGRAVYHNRHFFEVWHATADDLILNLCDEPVEVISGDEIASLVTLWCPEQKHGDTATESLNIQWLSREAAVFEVEGYLCGANWGDEPVGLPKAEIIKAGASFDAGWGVSTTADVDITLNYTLAPRQPIILCR